MQYEVGAHDYLWHRAVEVGHAKDFEIHTKWLVLDALLKQGTKIWFSHLA
jgi:hypothetical protein